MKSQFRTIRLRFRRLVRKRQRQASVVGQQTEQTIEQHVFGRFNRLRPVRRFVISWLLLVGLLIGGVVAQNVALNGYYQHRQPVPGGIFREGIVGAFTNANPIYAVNDVDSAVSELIFAGLFKFDNRNQLVGDLAESWQVDKTGQVYTVTLRPNLVWHDGQPLTATDVAFTYHVIQNPDAESPLRANWADIRVTATDKRTVTFTLPNPLSSFMFNLTNGIVPAHLLRDIPIAGLRSAPFNSQAPIGAGPFMWHDIHVSGSGPADAQQRIALLPFEQYWAGPPKLRTFTVHAFADSTDMVEAYRDNQLNAMAGLDHLPAKTDEQTKLNSYSFTLTAANMVFFRTSEGVLKDKTVRQALVRGADPAEIIKQLGYTTLPVREPVLANQFVYDPQYAQVSGQSEKAIRQLEKAGWRLGKDGIRVKKKQRLSFTLVAADTIEQRMVTEQLKRQWQDLGAEVTVSVRDDDAFQATLSGHDYDAVLYGITIGADPDVFVYWHSSQNDVRADNRLNLSEYESVAANVALEAGRTRAGEALRRAKYEPFLKAWQEDAPALGLYQPRFLYVSRSPIYGLNEHVINRAVERYSNVNNWMIRTANVTNDK